MSDYLDSYKRLIPRGMVVITKLEVMHVPDTQWVYKEGLYGKGIPCVRGGKPASQSFEEYTELLSGRMYVSPLTGENFYLAVPEKVRRCLEWPIFVTQGIEESLVKVKQEVSILRKRLAEEKSRASKAEMAYYLRYGKFTEEE